MKRCHWLKSVLVAQVKFTERTHDGQLRQPVFLGLRTDKEPKDVVRE
jgi:bifunctional non-homologous end joining protein LigD